MSDEEGKVPKKTASFRDKTLGAKLDFLEGILGHTRKRRDFDNRELAVVMAADPGQVSRKRTGNEGISHAELASLVDYFGLSPIFDHEVFKMEITAFKSAMRDARIGTYGGSSDSIGRNDLLRLAKETENRFGSGQRPDMKLRPLSRQRRAGGLGFADMTQPPKVELRIGEQVLLLVSVPGDGHIVILNDQLDVETVCLMPSMMAENTAVQPGQLKLPASIDEPYFDILPPAGAFRLFCIWTDTPPVLPWRERLGIGDSSVLEPPVALKPRELGQYVRQLPTAKAGLLKIGMLDYLVVR